MNYVERHFGDWARDTAHLSMLEDGAYNRLCDLYYVRETPLPEDMAACCRLVRAASKQERDAVASVLREFFDAGPDGWTHKRCDAEIAKFNAREPEREARKSNEDLRVKRHREERSALFKTLNEHGQHAAWNVPIAELRTLVQRLQQPLPATGPVTPATASHSPLPTTHTKKNPPAARVPPCPEGVTGRTWDDWLALRRAKKAPVTETVLKGAASEAAKAGLTLEAFLQVWCQRGSQGLQADWLKPEERGAAKPTFRERDQANAKARFSEWTGGAFDGANGEVIEMEVPHAARLASR